MSMRPHVIIRVCGYRKISGNAGQNVFSCRGIRLKAIKKRVYADMVTSHKSIFPNILVISTPSVLHL